MGRASRAKRARRYRRPPDLEEALRLYDLAAALKPCGRLDLTDREEAILERFIYGRPLGGPADGRRP